MQADDCPEGVLAPVLGRLNLESLGSIGFYREAARQLGWKELLARDLAPHLGRLAAGRGTSDSVLRPTAADPLSGQALHKEACVRIVKA